MVRFPDLPASPLRRRGLFGLMGAALLIAGLACSGTPTVQAPPASSAPPPVQGGGNVTLTVVNNTSSTVCFMRISPATSSDWGQDWLGSSMISSGSSYDFTVAAASYDLQAEFCGGGERTQMGVSITSNCTWTLQ